MNAKKTHTPEEIRESHIDEIIYQLEEGAAGDLNKLMSRLMIVNELVVAMKLDDVELNETQK